MRLGTGRLRVQIPQPTPWVVVYSKSSSLLGRLQSAPHGRQEIIVDVPITRRPAVPAWALPTAGRLRSSYKYDMSTHKEDISIDQARPPKREQTAMNSYPPMTTSDLRNLCDIQGGH
ncbi:hypothetical protein Ae201684_002786 [Aphanomyces euteiches]|uniref:Uncharacterized protein n=1 Tax=Aphanomyces euteiches TaxID=100861 RepID=A0A6G0XNX5_9STRA|nr:hypothetical protein Ae201684_002786 [Aphanomyces euteiches]